MTGNEMIKPPVMPKTIPKPPWNPAKTGRPMTPSSTYINVDIVLFFAPRATPANGMTNVCNVIGTP